MKTKIKYFSDQNTDFYDKEVLKVDSNYTCLTVIRLNFTLENDENYYPQVLLKKCKYIKKKVIRHINDNLSDFSNYYNSDKE